LASTPNRKKEKMKHHFAAGEAEIADHMLSAACPARTSLLVAQLYHGLRMRLEVALRPHGLTAIQYMILDLLSQHRGLSSAELSRRFFVTPQTMGEMIASLERRDLIIRTKDPENRRVLRVSLTPSGAALVTSCSITIDRIDSETLDPLSTADLERLRGTVIRLISAIRQPAI
jgi:DNA-binding MarR family transcriptional regulator